MKYALEIMIHTHAYDTQALQNAQSQKMEDMLQETGE